MNEWLAKYSTIRIISASHAQAMDLRALEPAADRRSSMSDPSAWSVMLIYEEPSHGNGI
jgi:hypothetical protein